MLGHLSEQEFLRDYWQKKPVLLKQAWPNFVPPLTADELAGLACEESVESRIILEHGDTPWQVMSGPFEESVFATLPETHWTLLVQDVDKLVPEVNALLQPFRFIPNWRIDDIMISYAAPQGSVGAHLDNYDVFLIQASGRRHWMIETQPRETENLLDDVAIKILSDFSEDEEWIVEPGDILYLPPRFAHHGISQDEDCMTYSVGFRAPDLQQMIGLYCDELTADLPENWFYTDAGLTQSTHSAQISDDVLLQLRETLLDAINNGPDFGTWFGKYITEPKTNIACLPEGHDASLEDFKSAFNDQPWILDIACQAVFTETPHRIHLFVFGEQFNFPRALKDCINELCVGGSVSQQTIESNTEFDVNELDVILESFYSLSKRGYLVPQDA